MSRFKLAVAAVALAATAPVQAAANFTFSAANGGTYSAPSVVAVTNAIGSGNGGAYTMTAVDANGNGTLQAKVVSGSVSNEYSAPYDTANHQITTNYFSTGTDAFNLTFSAAQKYLGLLIGSVGAAQGAMDLMSFYSGSTLVGKITGADITTDTSGAQTGGNSYFVNVNFATGFSFDKVVFTSQAPSMEFANIVYSANNVSAVPEPGMLGLFGLGALGLGLIRRRNAA